MGRAFPIRIKHWSDELGREAIFELFGEHGPYLVYMCIETGETVLVHKMEAWRYAV